MLSPLARELAWLTARPIAHRGLHDASANRIENTMAAFRAAVAEGYAIECDLQMSADGEAMVFHDSTLDRLTNARGKLSACTSAELKKIAFRNAKAYMSSLSELLDEAQGRVPLVIEIKSRWNGDIQLARRAVELLANYKGPHALMSFDPDIVAAVRQLSPAMVRGIVADRVAGEGWRRLPLARRLELRHLAHLERSVPHFISFDVEGLPWPPVQALRAGGMPVISWTVRSEAQAETALRYSDQITFEGFRP
jgi:glycerophosphoryl diester phosphodiesterase